jgi:hypothetical protein
MTSLADRLEEADRAAAERLAAIESARQDIQDALSHLELLVGNQSPPVGRFLSAKKANGQAKLSPRICATPDCGKSFKPRNAKQVYHSARCRKDTWEREKGGGQRRKREQPASDPEPAPVAVRSSAVELDVVLLPAKLRQQYSYSKKGSPEPSERDHAIADWAATARLVAGGLKGLPPLVIEQRLARCDAPFAAAVLAQLARR